MIKKEQSKVPSGRPTNRIRKYILDLPIAICHNTYDKLRQYVQLTKKNDWITFVLKNKQWYRVAGVRDRSPKTRVTLEAYDVHWRGVLNHTTSCIFALIVISISFVRLDRI